MTRYRFVCGLTALSLAGLLLAGAADARPKKARRHTTAITHEIATVLPGDASDPGCDRGYPYSGSARYFTGLTELRHSGPLALLLGEHVARPCDAPVAGAPVDSLY
jgi:hypothetical protein